MLQLHTSNNIPVHRDYTDEENTDENAEIRHRPAAVTLNNHRRVVLYCNRI